MALNTSLNYTLNTVSVMNSNSKGGAVNLSKKFFNDKFNNNLGVLYNTTDNIGKKNSVFGLKYMANYVAFKKHNFSIGAIQMLKSDSRQNLNELTINFNYGYNF